MRFIHFMPARVLIPLRRFARPRMFAASSALLCLYAGVATFQDFTPPAPLFTEAARALTKQIVDRHDRPLTYAYAGKDLNEGDFRSLTRLPELLMQAMVLSEDRRFFTHHGVDWQARAAALLAKLTPGAAHRGGGSTLTEQTIRMLHPRPRTLWSKWLEGLEAPALERAANKGEILEYYLNHVPYGRNRRGVVQAARLYFGRDVETLSPREMLALAVIVRSPERYAPFHAAASERLGKAVHALAVHMQEAGMLDALTVENMALSAPLRALAGTGTDPAEAGRFVEYAAARGVTHSTLDSVLQRTVHAVLERRLEALRAKHVGSAAALVADHRSGEILAWVSLGQGCAADGYRAPGCLMDMTQAPRQPGSVLKPFLYAAAFDHGLSPASLIDDAPFEASVGGGIHHFRNYSRIHYGWITPREALGNSLNIPAVKVLHGLGAGTYLSVLRSLGFDELTASAEYYDDGLALGAAEVTLMQMAAAYAALAQRGVYRPLRIDRRAGRARGKRIFSKEVASLIGHILSDPAARQMEFGASGEGAYPPHTAVKTGTSNDFRDAWAAGYNDRYVTAVWFGNVDRQVMDGITGSKSSAQVLKTIFGELTAWQPSAPLYVSPALSPQNICFLSPSFRGDVQALQEALGEEARVVSGPGNERAASFESLPPPSGKAVDRSVCTMKMEYIPSFLLARSRSREEAFTGVSGVCRSSPWPADEENEVGIPLWTQRKERRQCVLVARGQCVAQDKRCERVPKAVKYSIHMGRPSPGLMLAMDPRVPKAFQAFRMEAAVTAGGGLALEGAGAAVTWEVDGRPFAAEADGSLLWPLSRGEHTAQAFADWPAGGERISSEKVTFTVR